jgi:hypothetical protein
MWWRISFILLACAIPGFRGLLIINMFGYCVKLQYAGIFKCMENRK